jgi:hypothetical protein
MWKSRGEKLPFFFAFSPPNQPPMEQPTDTDRNGGWNRALAKELLLGCPPSGGGAATTNGAAALRELSGQKAENVFATILDKNEPVLVKQGGWVVADSGEACCCSRRVYFNIMCVCVWHVCMYVYTHIKVQFV